MIATASPVTWASRGRERLGNTGRRTRAFGIALAMCVSALLVAGPAPSFANHEPPACTTNQQQGTLCLSVTDTTDPVIYSDFDGNSGWLFYSAVVTNASRSSTLSHVQLREELDASTTFVSASSSRGSCTNLGQSVACAIGSLKKGQSATVEVVVRAPASSDPNPPDMTIANTVSANFDERFSDQPNGGKQDTVTLVEPTTVSTSAGQAYVPNGRSGKVGTDPGQAQYASSSIPNASADLLAAIQVGPSDTFCGDDGTVRIRNKTYVCRAGGFVEASVTNADTGATYSNSQSPMVFHLRWDAPLVSDKQTEKNFAVFYQSTAASPIQVFDEPCNASASNAPCLRNITLDGSAEVDLVKADNGRMR